MSSILLGSGSKRVVFAIGTALKGNINLEKNEIFGVEDDSCMDYANHAVSFYESQSECARLAVDTWTIIGIRFGVVKDVRKLIGKLVWDARLEANYVTADSIDDLFM